MITRDEFEAYYNKAVDALGLPTEEDIELWQDNPYTESHLHKQVFGEDEVRLCSEFHASQPYSFEDYVKVAWVYNYYLSRKEGTH